MPLSLIVMRDSTIGEDVVEGEIKGGDEGDGKRLREDRRAAQQVQREGDEQLEQRSQQVCPLLTLSSQVRDPRMKGFFR